MGMQINTNVMAINARNSLAATNLRMSKALEKLSSGLRINRAADDAAGLAVSEKLRAQVKGLAQASRNAQDGISMIQTAEGALNETHAMLQRMRELSVQAANDTLSPEDRAAIATEMSQLKSEMNNISNTTKFNGKNLLTGNLATSVAAASELKLGTAIANGGGTGSVTAVDVTGAKTATTYTLTSTATTVTLSGNNVTQTVATAALTAGNSATFNFDKLGVKFTLQATAGFTQAEVGAALSTAANDTITTAAGSGAANFQIGAGQSDAISVNFDKVDTDSMALTNAGAGALDLFLTTQSVANAQGLIGAVDTAIGSVNTTRANLGAYQNRLEHTINSLGVAVENLSASESRIRDTDVASETSNMVTAQILTQAGTAVLSQANQAPQGALALLRG